MMLYPGTNPRMGIRTAAGAVPGPSVRPDRSPGTRRHGCGREARFTGDAPPPQPPTRPFRRDAEAGRPATPGGGQNEEIRR